MVAGGGWGGRDAKYRWLGFQEMVGGRRGGGARLKWGKEKGVGGTRLQWGKGKGTGGGGGVGAQDEETTTSPS